MEDKLHIAKDIGGYAIIVYSVSAPIRVEWTDTEERANDRARELADIDGALHVYVVTPKCRIANRVTLRTLSEQREG